MELDELISSLGEAVAPSHRRANISDTKCSVGAVRPSTMRELQLLHRDVHKRKTVLFPCLHGQYKYGVIRAVIQDLLVPLGVGRAQDQDQITLGRGQIRLQFAKRRMLFLVIDMSPISTV